MGTVTDFIFLGSKITVDSDCSHEIKRHLLPERKVMINLDSMLKSRNTTLLTKICIVKAMTDFIFLGFKITVNDECSYEMKRCLLLGRKAMTNLDSVLKNKNITLPTEVHIVKAMVFLVVMYELDHVRVGP